MSKNILIRCDASKEIGLGHIIRCMELAKQLKNNNFNIIFAIKPYKEAIGLLEQNSYQFESANLENFNYQMWIKSLIQKYKINLFIGDIRDGFPSSLLKDIKKQNILTIAIDEPSEYAKECDLCFYPPHAIINKTQFNGNIYQGLEYVILRENFYKPFQKKQNKVPNILVMMGGTDLKNLTFKIIKLLDKQNFSFNLLVILPTNHIDFLNIKSFSRSSHHKISIHSNVKDMSNFLNHIDYAVVSFGTIIYELINKKIPTNAINLLNDTIDKIILKHYNIQFIQLQTLSKSLSFLSNTYKTPNKNKVMEKILDHIKGFNHVTK